MRRARHLGALTSLFYSRWQSDNSICSAGNNAGAKVCFTSVYRGIKKGYT